MFVKTIDLIKRLWSAAPFAVSILALALTASLFFGVRSAIFWYDRPPMAEREQPVAAWMTPRYISHSWRVPREVVLEAIDAPQPFPRGPVSLTQLADGRGVPVEQMIQDVENAIFTFRESHKPPGPPPKPAEGAADD